MFAARLRGLIASLLVAALIAVGLASGGSPTLAPAASSLPAIKHVFIIVLENESEATSFGPGAPSPYLAQTLPAMGVFLPKYYAIGHASLDNYIAIISGQAPDEQTRADCGTYESFVFAKFAENGQAEGHGCVYPSNVPNITEQLTAHGYTWKGYMQSMPRACAHPTLGGPDEEGGKAGDEYATRHDPFMYFASVTASTAYCEEHVVNLSSLEGALSTAATTPNLVWITPDVCSDGHEATCQESSRPGGFAGINEFLSTWVPKITSSAAFKESGLLVVTFDEAEQGQANSSFSCCGEVPGPNAPLPGGTGPGGGQVGAVLVSPYITPGTTSNVEYNHYSVVASVEDSFGLPNLGMAGVAGLPTFGSDVYSQPAGTPTTGTATATTTTATATGATTTTGVATTGSVTGVASTGATTTGTSSTAATTTGAATTTATTSAGATTGGAEREVGKPSAGKASARGALASVPISCAGATGASCPIDLSLSVVETVKGAKVIAVAAGYQNSKSSERTVTVGSTATTLAGGQNETLRVALNRTGQRLLKRQHTLPVALTATSQGATGAPSAFSSQVLHFNEPGK